MASSGIAEHNEARRIERMRGRKAYKKMMMKEEADRGVDPTRLVEQQHENTYHEEAQHVRKLGCPPGMPTSGHDARAVDRRRREEFMRQEELNYSAKLPNRFSSTDYISQW